MDKTELEEYQEWVDSTLIPDRNSDYQLLVLSNALGGEVGETQNVIKKYYMDKIDFDETTARVQDELGDVLWYVAAIANELDIPLDAIILDNIQKINARHSNKV